MTTPPITDQPPPDLVALVEAFEESVRQAAAEWAEAAINGIAFPITKTLAANNAKAALLAALGRAPAPTGERVPSAMWEPARDVGSDGDVRLFARPFCAGASLAGPWTVIMMAERPDGVDAYTVVASGIATSKRAAQLAAEDALIAVRDEITRAVGR